MKRNRQDLSGFSLVEVTLSLAVAGFALIALFGLLPVGFTSNQAAINQTVAANILTAIAADLRAATVTATTSPRLGISLTQASSTYYLDESGGPFPAISSPAAASHYRVTTTVTPAPAGQRGATMVSVVVSWPPVADPSKAAGLVSTFVGLDRN